MPVAFQETFDCGHPPPVPSLQYTDTHYAIQNHLGSSVWTLPFGKRFTGD